MKKIVDKDGSGEREKACGDHMGYSAHYSSHLKLVATDPVNHTFTHLWLPHFYHLTICIIFIDLDLIVV